MTAAGRAATTRLLIVNADDYGLTPGVSRAILRAHAEGIVTSTSALALAPGFEPSAACAARHAGHRCRRPPGRRGRGPAAAQRPRGPDAGGQGGAGCRRRGGCSCPAWRRAASTPTTCVASSRPRSSASAPRASPSAHVDTHQHLHLWPSVGEVVLDVAAAADITAMRIIRSAEPGPRRRDRAAPRPAARTPGPGAGRPLPRHRDRARRGRHARPAPPRPARSTVWRPTPGPSAELATHPGEADDPDLDRYRGATCGTASWRPSSTPPCAGRVEGAGFRLGTYADLEAVGVSAAIGARDPAAGAERRVRDAYARSAAATGSTWRSAGARARSPRSRRACPAGPGRSTSAAATALFALYLAATAPGRSVTGVDVDAAKLASARRRRRTRAFR